MLTHLRFASTILVGLLIGAIYHDAGNDASKTFNNGGNLFFGLLFIVFSSMMMTVLTCKANEIGIAASCLKLITHV